ncbi:MAG: hypothetical protein H7330_02955 [Hymenobacteraceae bacterium]|nr:hypothetical protein [Hymenobacteraceae bacterium]
MPIRFRSLRALGLLCAVPTLLTACKKDKEVIAPALQPDPQARAVVYVVNQGNFLRANAAITRYTRTSGAVVRDQFAAANPGVALGDVAQSMTIFGDKGYIVVNNSNRIAVVQLLDFKQVAEITGLEQPRYLAVFGGKGYVTEWGLTFGAAGRVSEIDLGTNTRTGRTFATDVQPEEITATTTGLLVANAGANVLTTINLTTGATSAIRTPMAPTAVRLDANGRAWVLCSGLIAYDAVTYDVDTANSTPGALFSFSPTNPSDSTTRLFNRRGTAPGNLLLAANGTRLYYTYHGNVFTMSTTDPALPRTALIRRRFDALGLDPADNTLYCADQRGFTADGRVLRYRLSGAVIDSFATAVGPTQFVF